MKSRSELEAIAKKYLLRFAKEGPHGWVEREVPALTELLLEVQAGKEETKATPWYNQMIEYFKY